MQYALQLAAGASGQTDINPVVGCVVVKSGRIVGLGAHLRRGEGHAEVHALQMAGDEAEGATVYVTLEPCSHFGRTPPCSNRLVAAKVARVVVACQDPNPQVAGRGLAQLRAAGIEVKAGVLEQQAQALNEAFNKYIVTGYPFVTLKTAMTLDGKIASYTGDSRYVSGAAAREKVHAMRHRHSAIMIGVDTAIADDPELTTRLPVPGLNPARIIADSRLRLPLDARLLKDKAAPVIVLTTAQASEHARRQLEQQGARVLVCGAGPHVDLDAAMRQLGQLEISSILLEGGGKLSGAMIELGLVDKLVLFIAPKLIGGENAPGAFVFQGFERMADAVPLERMQVELLGGDICVTGYLPKRKEQ
ncbi:bifunctional diaminohydroxyphosphoribosylaminopyrimidine deaminase/5-amino-6-(5-phosphoribosylamino)uracil reductase RibD [Paenibacillus sp. GCM10027626]|uniref:bifunctional diaminohydroxyphosphoribosylaminopyrimidine deaminase/5-amino-6-(5-phosphoribosylamino)uracil reductase RibD n=1 Tax=Paenibacillus sp. GCM10027626 TaxID=3273411 RepID=UPI003629A660